MREKNVGYLEGLWRFADQDRTIVLSQKNGQQQENVSL